MAKILQKGNEKAPNGPLLIKASCNVDLRKECHPDIKSNGFVLCVSSFHTEISLSPVIEDFWKFAHECMQKIQKSFFAGQHHRFLKQCRMILAAVEQHGTVPPSQQDLRVFNLSNLGKQAMEDGTQGTISCGSTCWLSNAAAYRTRVWHPMWNH